MQEQKDEEKDAVKFDPAHMLTLEDADRECGLTGRIVYAVVHSGKDPVVMAVYRRAHTPEEWKDEAKRIPPDEFSMAFVKLCDDGILEAVEPDRCRLCLNSPDALFQAACSTCTAGSQLRAGRAATKAQAEADGWIFQGNLAYCPECAAKRPALKPFVEQARKKASRAERRGKGREKGETAPGGQMKPVPSRDMVRTINPKRRQ